jgi:polyhydroxybutyrate depolymerase
MQRILLILVHLLILGQSGFAQQTINGAIMHDGMQRTYILYVPDSYQAGEPSPLVFNFHGYTSNANNQMFYGDFRSIADTAGFLIVHPMGTNDGNGQPFWNAGFGANVDDVGFTIALIDHLADNYAVDLDRIYSTGMSNGGYMSFTLACELSNRFAAIASVTGSMVSAQLLIPGLCTPVHPTPAISIHGTADATVPYNGNAGSASIPDVLNYWVNFNQCDADPLITQLPDINMNDGSTVEHIVYAGGRNGSTVEHYKIFNGGHTWPGTFFNSAGTNQDFNASLKIWEFFRRYSLDKLNELDEDEDGYTSSEDCDDTNADVNPGATEIPYNSLDDDCNPETPDDDLDGDGFDMAMDCDDENSTINPDAEEIPNNGIDEDCDGEDLVTGIYSANGFTFKIFPNPAINRIYISTREKSDLSIRIFDLLGGLVYSSSFKEYIDVERFEKGTYLLEITNLQNGAISISKFLKVNN